MAVEIMIPNSAIRNLIREDKVHQIYSMMQTGQDTHGMVTMNQSLCNFYTKGTISYDVAMARSPRPEELATMMSRVGGKVGIGDKRQHSEPFKLGRP
jgi:twitching motility protein PilT